MHYSKTVRFEHQKAAIFAVTQSDATPKLAVGAFVPSLRFAVTQSDATPKLVLELVNLRGVLLLPRVTLLQNAVSRIK